MHPELVILGKPFNMSRLLPVMILNPYLATPVARTWQRNMASVASRATRYLWGVKQMGRIDAAMQDALPSSPFLSTTPFVSRDPNTLIIIPLCVSLPAGGPGKCKRCSFFYSLAITFLLLYPGCKFDLR